MKAIEVFAGSNGAMTRKYYSRLSLGGPIGEIAMNLFRAQKCSTRAKKYHGGIRGVGSFSNLSYDKKAWSLEELCRILGHHSEQFHIGYGWKLDASQPRATWVLYGDLPQGQVSFHSTARYAGPDYAGDWDHQRASEMRILAFCDSVWENVGHAGGTAFSAEQDAFHFA
jgi:hypothetical protein